MFILKATLKEFLSRIQHVGASHCGPSEWTRFDGLFEKDESLLFLSKKKIVCAFTGMTRSTGTNWSFTVQNFFLCSFNCLIE